MSMILSTGPACSQVAFGSLFRKRDKRPAYPLRYLSGEQPSDVKPKMNARVKTKLFDGVHYAMLHPRRILPLLPLGINPVFPSHKLGKLLGSKPFEFKTVDNQTLAGYWWPAPGGSEKTMVMGHGYYGGTSSFYPLGEKLRQSGWNVFLFDMRGQGQSDHGPVSLGFHEGKDIAAAVASVKSQFPGQSQTLYYLGHSAGSSAMLMTPESLKPYPAAKKQFEDSVDGIILDSPYHTLNIADDSYVKAIDRFDPQKPLLKRSWQRIQPRVSRYLSEYTDATLAAAQDKLQLPFPLEALNTADIFTPSPLSRKPVLLLHGAQDTRIPLSESEAILRAVQKAGGNQISLTPLQADHRVKATWHPGYKHVKFNSVLRDDQRYLQALTEFLPK